MRLSRVLPLALIFLPSVAFAAAMTFQELAMTVVNIIELGTVTLIMFAIVAYFWGISSNIGHFGHDDKEGKKKSYFLWGIVIIFVMVCIWGIIQLLKDSLFGNDLLDSTTGTERQVTCDNFGGCALR